MMVKFAYVFKQGCPILSTKGGVGAGFHTKQAGATPD